MSRLIYRRIRQHGVSEPREVQHATALTGLKLGRLWTKTGLDNKV